MKTIKIVLLAVLLCLLCIFLPEGMSDMEWQSGIRVGREQMQRLVSDRMEKMRSLGITEADGKLEEEILEDLRSAPEDDTIRLTGETGEMAAIDSIIFQRIGSGEYNYVTWEWTPGSKQVYMFDVEVFNVGSMYTDFMNGILALMDGEADITDIGEDTSGVDWETGTGTQILRFKCNGNPYEFQAEAYYDWMDVRVVDFINDMLEKEQIDKRLWVSFDGGQGFIIFFQTKEWAKEFQEIMGYGLLNAEG